MRSSTKASSLSSNRSFGSRYFALAALLTSVGYYFSNPKPQFYYDYTFRVAGRLLGGALGLSKKPPGHLNEFVPFDGAWFSVFPLGAVLTMIPAATLKAIGVINDMPAALIVALLAAGTLYFLLKIGSHYDLPNGRVLLTSLGILFGTWMWTNLTFGGAWQLALGFAMLGELGAIYFTVYDRRPLLAGAFFALGFGNRTEVLLTAPILMLLLVRSGGRPLRGCEVVSGQEQPPATAGGTGLRSELLEALKGLKGSRRRIAAFCAVPFVLGAATLAYNYARFGTPFDFGYARIPGVLEEPWYNHGIFSVRYIPGRRGRCFGSLGNSGTHSPTLCRTHSAHRYCGAARSSCLHCVSGRRTRCSNIRRGWRSRR